MLNKETEITPSQGIGTPFGGYSVGIAVESGNCRKGPDSMEDLCVEFMEDGAEKIRQGTDYSLRYQDSVFSFKTLPLSSLSPAGVDFLL